MPEVIERAEDALTTPILGVPGWVLIGGGGVALFLVLSQVGKKAAPITDSGATPNASGERSFYSYSDPVLSTPSGYNPVIPSNTQAPTRVIPRDESAVDLGGSGWPGFFWRDMNKGGNGEVARNDNGAYIGNASSVAGAVDIVKAYMAPYTNPTNTPPVVCALENGTCDDSRVDPPTQPRPDQGYIGPPVAGQETATMYCGVSADGMSFCT